MLRLHWSYQYSQERYTSLLLLVNNFWTHKWSGLVVVFCVFIYTKTCPKQNYFIIGWMDISIWALHLCCDNCICNLFEQKGSIFNYGIFKMLLKFIWPVPATGINYLWLSFFSCSSVMHAILAIIRLAPVWCFEYVTDDECIISQGMLCVTAMY